MPEREHNNKKKLKALTMNQQLVVPVALQAGAGAKIKQPSLLQTHQPGPIAHLAKATMKMLSGAQTSQEPMKRPKNQRALLVDHAESQQQTQASQEATSRRRTYPTEKMQIHGNQEQVARKTQETAASASETQTLEQTEVVVQVAHVEVPEEAENDDCNCMRI